MTTSPPSIHLAHTPGRPRPTPLVFAAVAILLLLVAALAHSATIAVLALGMTIGMWLGASRTAPSTRSPAGEDGLAATAARALAPVLHHCEDAIVLTDAALRIRYANDAFAQLSGRTIDTPAETTLLEAVRHRIADDEGFVRALADLTRNGRAATGEITHLGTPARTFEWRAIPLVDEDGALRSHAFLFHDRSQAQELAGLKSDFLSTVTHELRTPLTSVKGSLQLVLGKSTALSAIDSELLNISLKNADRLIRLINDLLDISRLELGKIELTFGRVPTASLLEEAAAGLRAYAGGRDITIECEVDAQVPALLGDRDRLIQVLTNLISNAIKFSPASGRVRVAASRHDDGEIAVEVQDWGIGIPAADQCRLFQRFERLNRGRSDEPGTGLGLAISKAIVERHGGRITLASAEQAGSTFTIFVPAFQEATPRLPSAVHADTPRPTVLLVDDDDALRSDLERVLADHYEVTCVRRGLDALDVARDTRPDVVLLDVVLPDLSGYDVLRILRTTGATASLPVIMLTVQPERALAASLGACDVVAKPVDLDQLRRAIDQALQDRDTAPIELRAASR